MWRMMITLLVTCLLAFSATTRATASTAEIPTVYLVLGDSLAAGGGTTDYEAPWTT